MLLISLFLLTMTANEVLSTEEVQCVYSNQNLCETCSMSIPVKNISKTLSSNVSLLFCSESLQLNEVIKINSLSKVTITGFSQRERVIVNCSRHVEAGITFINVTNVEISYLSFIGCGFHHYHTSTENLTLKSGIFFANSYGITIHNVLMSHSTGAGISFINTIGTVNIENVMFSNNNMPKNCSNCNTESSGGLYIELTPNCKRPRRNKCSSYKVSNCEFDNNRASSSHSHHDFVDWDNLNKGRGGGLTLILSGKASQNNIDITDCTFASNSAQWGGGIYILLRNSSNSNQLRISHVNFTGNMCRNGGGGLAIGIFYSGTYSRQNNSIQILSCGFVSNHANNGGAVTVYATQHNSLARISNSVEFNNCTWENNTAIIGAAVDLSSHIWMEEKGFLPTMKFTNCEFTRNYIQNDEHQQDGYTYHNKGKGIFYSTGYEVEFSGNLTFQNNAGSGLYLVSSIANFCPESNANFVGNEGFAGGALSLVGFSVINFGDNSTFEFADNIAKDRGGAIFTVTINKKDLIDTQTCFIQYTGNHSKVPDRRTTFRFTNNSAGVYGRNVEVEGHYGHSVFASSLKPCLRKCMNAKSHNYSMVFDCIADFTFTNKNKYEVSTSGAEIKLLKTVKLPLKVIPGKFVELPINMMDEFGHEIGDLFHVLVSNSINSSKISIEFSDAYISEKWIRFYGLPGFLANITIETVNIREVGITFAIELQECPPGYVQDKFQMASKVMNTCICSASSKEKRYSGIHRCNDTNFVALLQRGYWIGYDEPGRSFGTESKLVSGYCPRGYCFTNSPSDTLEREYYMPPNTSIAHLDRLICAGRRTGVLCGRCVENYTSFYHSRTYKCKPAEKCEWGWLFYILSEIIPVTLLFVVIMVFNIKLTTGAFNAFLYYAQVSDTMLISANGFIVFPQTAYTFVRINHFFARMFNLNFFAISEMSFCLWKRAQTLDLLVFKYVTVTYALLLVFVIIAFMRCCNCQSRYRIVSKMREKKVSARNTIIHGLTGFLVMCYSECTRVSLLILTPVSLKASSLEADQFTRKVVFYNGELAFFKGKHLYYAIPALLVLILLGILPPLMLLSYPLCYRVFAFLKISETRFVSILCQVIPLESLRPFFDSFQSSFKDNYRFFAGLYFVYRLVMFFNFAYLHNLTEFYLMVQAQLVIILAVHAIIQPYKKRWHNIIDGMIFMILAIVNAMTLFNYKHATGILDYKHVIHTIAKIQTTLLYAPMLYICIYLIIITYKKLNLREVWIKMNMKWKGESLKNDVSTTSIALTKDDDSCDFLDSDYHHRETDDSQDRDNI